MSSQIFKEEVFDLLDPNPMVLPKGDGVSSAKPVGPARAPIHIRETVNGGITLAGVTEAEVRTKEEMASYLLRGSVSRATGSTNMNSQSRCVRHVFPRSRNILHVEIKSSRFLCTLCLVTI